MNRFSKMSAETCDVTNVNHKSGEQAEIIILQIPRPSYKGHRALVAIETGWARGTIHKLMPLSTLYQHTEMIVANNEFVYSKPNLLEIHRGHAQDRKTEVL